MIVKPGVPTRNLTPAIESGMPLCSIWFFLHQLCERSLTDFSLTLTGLACAPFAPASDAQLRSIGAGRRKTNRAGRFLFPLGLITGLRLDCVLTNGPDRIIIKNRLMQIGGLSDQAVGLPIVCGALPPGKERGDFA